VNDSATTPQDAPVSIDVRVNDSDPDGNPLTLVSVTQPSHGTAVIATTGPNAGTVTYQPAANFAGTDSFAYTISDGTLTATAVVTVTVTAVNHAPTANNDAATTPAGTEVVIDVLANDADVDGDSLTVTAVGAPQQGSTVLVASGLNAGRISYLPLAGFVGIDQFTYTIGDGRGGTATATVSVTVTAVNRAPAAMNDVATVVEDTATALNVLSNDSDPDNDVLVIAGLTQPASGGSAVTGTGPIAGQVVYTPGADFVGTDSFTYTIADGHGGASTATVTVTVTAVNDAPVAVNDVATVAEDATVAINVTANDLDVDGDVLGIIAVSTPAHGTATLLTLGPDAGRVSYTPAANFAGADSFTYTVSDGHGGTATASVSVTVTAVNDAPIAADDGAATTGPTPVAIAVLANDVDVDGDPLSVTAIGAPAHGTAVLLTGPDAGKVSYTAEAGFVGSDSFTYTITDGLATATATVTVIVSPGE
jgi:hypothetical protein